MQWKSNNITYSDSVSVALVIEHAVRMRRTILSSVACLGAPFFSTLCHKRRGFGGKKKDEHKSCVLILAATFIRNISHSNKKSARYYHKST